MVYEFELHEEVLLEDIYRTEWDLDMRALLTEAQHFTNVRNIDDIPSEGWSVCFIDDCDNNLTYKIKYQLSDWELWVRESALKHSKCDPQREFWSAVRMFEGVS